MVYQLCYTLPRWHTLVSAHLAAGGTSAAQALALLVLFGAAYNIHSYAQVLARSKPSALKPQSWRCRVLRRRLRRVQQRVDALLAPRSRC